MKFDHTTIIDKYYPADTPVRGILLRHSRSVADMALSILVRKPELGLSPEETEAAAMLHDIGIFLTDAPGIYCHGKEPYLMHGVLGADLLRAEGAPEKYARVAERHTGAGITADDVRRLGLPMPVDRVLMPESALEQLVCYADCFYSKSGDMARKDLSRVREGMARFGPEILRRFDALHHRFGS